MVTTQFCLLWLLCSFRKVCCWLQTRSFDKDFRESTSNRRRKGWMELNIPRISRGDVARLFFRHVLEARTNIDVTRYSCPHAASLCYTMFSKCGSRKYLDAFNVLHIYLKSVSKISFQSPLYNEHWRERVAMRLLSWELTQEKSILIPSDSDWSVSAFKNEVNHHLG